MSKLPFIKFFPLDWMRDTRQLSHTAKAVWIDVLCMAWNEANRGVYVRTWTGFLQEHHLDGETAAKILEELKSVALRVTLRNEKVTVISKRMLKEEKSRKDNAKRQHDFRMKHKSNATVTPETLDVRSQTLENNKDKDTHARVFQRPTAQEVTAYALSISYRLNGQAFVDHYEARGWKYNGGVSMRDWRAAVRTWKRRDPQNVIVVKPAPVPEPELSDEERRQAAEVFGSVRKALASVKEIPK